MKGFTLIELMIVVAIVGILVATALPVYQNAKCRQNGTATEKGQCVRNGQTAVPQPARNNESLVGAEYPTGQGPMRRISKTEATDEALSQIARDCKSNGRTIFITDGIEYEFSCSFRGKRSVQ